MLLSKLKNSQSERKRVPTLGCRSDRLMSNASLNQQKSDVSRVVEVRWISLGITCQIVGRRTGTCAFNSLETIPLSKTNSPRTVIFLGKLAVINQEHQSGTYQNIIHLSVVKPIHFFAIGQNSA
ncbi:hypothetical protein [uncultured Nostoc sp.]|uniref:hypothetical protein n=1 Tax=uncultured Nostoc sp. TaxID=340711 RepID=UPI0035C9C4E3